MICYKNVVNVNLFVIIADNSLTHATTDISCLCFFLNILHWFNCCTKIIINFVIATAKTTTKCN